MSLMKRYIKVNPARFFIYVFITALGPILITVNTYLLQLETNIVLSRNWNHFILITCATLAAIVLAYISMSLQLYLENIQFQDLSGEVRGKLVNHYYADGKNHSVSEMQNRLTNDLQIINENYFHQLGNLIYGIVTIIGVLIYLFLLNWWLLVVILMMTLVSYFLPKLIEKPLEEATEQISKENEKYIDTLNNWLGGLSQIQQFMAGARLFSVTEKASKKLEDANVKQTAYTKALNAISGAVSSIFGLIVFVLAGYLVSKGQVEIGVLIVIGNFRFNLSQSINLIIGAKGQMKGSHKLIEEVNKDMTPVDRSLSTDKEVPVSISTENLRLKFENGEALHYPNIEIKQGEKILLTGDSGSGKSTLFKLILGELKPSSGKVLFRNKDGKEINPDLSGIGYIPQDPIVFPATIEDNVTMFNDKLNNRVDNVIRDVNFKADIDNFKNGVNEELNLDNLNISGGQRQKIVLARAKVHDSDIILIDEGTSAIDQKATVDILHRLLKSKATIVFIAHNFNEELHKMFDREIHLAKE